VAFDDGRHLVEVPTHHAAEGFRVEALAEGRGSRDVCEDDRDDPADVGSDALSLAEWSRAVLAEASLVGVLFSAGRAPLHGRILEGALRRPHDGGATDGGPVVRRRSKPYSEPYG
jgi:hypothetical protein